MSGLLKYAVVLTVLYFAAWTASYACMMVSRGDGLDFGYYFEYLRLAWTGGGELPSFIEFFSIILFLPLAMLAGYLLRRQDRPAKPPTCPSGRYAESPLKSKC